MLCDKLHALILLEIVSRETGQQPFWNGRVLTSIQGVFIQLMLKVTPAAAAGVSHHSPGVCFREVSGDELLQAPQAE